MLSLERGLQLQREICLGVDGCMCIARKRVTT